LPAFIEIASEELNLSQSSLELNTRDKYGFISTILSLKTCSFVFGFFVFVFTVSVKNIFYKDNSFLNTHQTFLQKKLPYN